MSQSTALRWPVRFLLRPLFIFVSFMLVLFAIFQASGRLVMTALHLFENQIAVVSGEFGVELEGLQGGWAGLNPQIQLQHVVFPGGRATGVNAELDVLESIKHSAWVLKSLDITELSLVLVQGDSGWQLQGRQAGEMDFDVADLLNFSDELSTKARISFLNRAGV